MQNPLKQNLLNLDFNYPELITIGIGALENAYFSCIVKWKQRQESKCKHTFSEITQNNR